ncbi:MAG: glycosyltransferase family 1 protein [Pirellulales bacterium]
MRILYDGMIYACQKAGGINRYFSQLIDRLPNDTTPVLTATQYNTDQFPSHPNLEVYQWNYKKWPRPIRWLPRALKGVYFQSLTERKNYDIQHPTYYESLLGKRGHRKHAPLVLTVHDMIHERFSEMVDPARKHAAIKRRAILQADAIICVSEKTKSDLLEYYDLPDTPISVVYHGCELQVPQDSQASPPVDRPYYLYVGARHGYKNFDRLLQAMSVVCQNGSPIDLHITGAPLSNMEIRKVNQLGLTEHIIPRGYLDDKALADEYRFSLAVVYPSLYEGFGIPPLEAMCCGTAVIAANTSSIPEVVGDAGILFDPYSVGELSEILLEFPKNESQRSKLIELGYQRQQQFSWDKMAKETIQVYQQVLAAA